VLLTTHYLEEADGCDQVAFIKSGRIVQRGAPRDLVDALGRHIVEIEADDLDVLTSTLKPRLGSALTDGDVAMFRYAYEDASALAALQTELAGRVSTLRIRRPNLNDVFLWVNSPP